MQKIALQRSKTNTASTPIIHASSITQSTHRSLSVLSSLSDSLLVTVAVSWLEVSGSGSLSGASSDGSGESGYFWSDEEVVSEGVFEVDGSLEEGDEG